MATEMSQFKSGYLARTSHELRSPLNGLIGMHQLILSDLCDSREEEREFLAQAHTSARKMVEVLDRVVDAARVQHGTSQLTIQPIPLTQIFQEVYNLTQLLAKDRNVRLHMQPPDPGIYVQVDHPRFRQILLHLVDSAILRLPEEGITVSAKLSAELGDVHIWINDSCPLAARTEPVNLLQPETFQSETFKPETATNLPLPSPGLNLLIVQMLLQSMQGRLEVVPIHSNLTGSGDTDKGDVLTQIRCSLPGYRMPEE
jgi:signal transduction histidine kinase